MNPTASLERMVEALGRAQRHWRERSQKTSGAFTIALTREAGAPGTSVAREVGAKLGWPVYDHELLERIAQETGWRVNLLESVDERRRHWLLECVEALARTPTVSEGSYVRHLIETVLSLGAHGECVIVGRGAAQTLPPATTLRVRLVGPLEDRIAATSQRLAISRAEAARIVAQTDRERSTFIKDHFHKDPTDPGNYDLLINFTRWSVAECADLIVAALHRLQARGRP
jgi:cytidylate kinase